MLKRDLIRNLILFVILLIAIFLIQQFVYSTFKVHEDAANANMSNGDIVVVNQQKEPQEGDQIVYKEGKVFYISRVIATKGQTLTVMDDILYKNGQIIEEPYLEDYKNTFFQQADSQANFTSDFTIESLTNNKNHHIPENHVLVLNDNRENTNDSRKFGLIEKSKIRGVISFKLYPLSEFGFLQIKN